VLVPLWLVQARAFIDAHFAERLALATLAAAVGVHPVHLARTFRRVYRTTIGAYVREARVDFARRRLVATTAPIAAIAAEAGFCDQSHFCRQFKRQIGMSPAEYRAAAAR
jgi:AraC family transcriptional regulator